MRVGSVAGKTGATWSALPSRSFSLDHLLGLMHLHSCCCFVSVWMSYSETDVGSLYVRVPIRLPFKGLEKADECARQSGCHE
jgi:hypothetical protein